jgi:ubiquinone/menaquinone biosynthesis C-methylase UbiE
MREIKLKFIDFYTGGSKMLKTKRKFINRTPKQRLAREKLLQNAIDEISNEFKEGDSLLDVGCGDGILLNMLAQNQADKIELHGMDITKQHLNMAIAKAKENNLNIDFFLGSITDIPCKDNSFDFVFCTMMFHHLSKQYKEPALKEIRRVLKKGGKLIFVDEHPPAGLLKKILAKPYFIYLYMSHSGTSYAIGKVAQLIKNAGFEIDKEIYLAATIKMIVAKA